MRGRQDRQEAEQSPSGLGTLRFSWCQTSACLSQEDPLIGGALGGLTGSPCDNHLLSQSPFLKARMEKGLDWSHPTVTEWELYILLSHVLKSKNRPGFRSQHSGG